VKRLFAIFVLTPAEQRVVIIVVLLLLAGAWFKQYRDSRLRGPALPPPSASPAISRSPSES
jgi:hypothetical protein